MNTPAPSSIAEARPDGIATIPLLVSLRGELNGTISLPSDPEWDEARSAWQLAVDQRPAAVVRAASVRDVVLAVNAARAAGLRVAPQGTGHNAAPLGPLDGTILLRTGGLDDVSIDPVARIARIGSGAVWSAVTARAAEHGLAALAGSSADVGVTGYLLGGGVSWLARSHGLAINDVVAVELVTADGRRRRIDSEHEAELFWAVRGGGGNVGVVTAIELRLHPVTEVYAGTLFFPISESARVLQAWREWTKDVPEQVTSVGRILQLPPLPELPDFLRGQSFVVVEAAMQLTAAEADAVLAPLRALGPAIDTFHCTPMTELDQLHMDPEGPVPGVGDGFMLRELAAETVDAFVAVAGADSGSALLTVEIRHLGGAASRRAENGGVVSHLEAEFLVFGAGIAMTPEIGAAARASLDRLVETLAPWTAPMTYQNFAETPAAPGAIWGSSLDRLRAIKAVYDPRGMIRSNHPIG